mgnify:CR=1 FL=1
MPWAQPLLWGFGLCALTCRAEVLSPPSLLLNASRSITVNWQPAAEAHLGYELHLSVARRGQPAFHVTKRAAADAHSLFWGEMPEDAQCCFRIAAVTAGEITQYSEDMCFSSCACSTEGGAPDTAVLLPSCLGHTLGGAILGAALVLLGCAALLRPEWALGARQQARAWARSLAGGPYSHLTTQEECVHTASSSATHGYELEARGVGRGGGGGGGGSGSTTERVYSPVSSPNTKRMHPPPLGLTSLSGPAAACAASSSVSHASHASHGSFIPLPPLEGYPMVYHAGLEPRTRRLLEPRTHSLHATVLQCVQTGLLLTRLSLALDRSTRRSLRSSGARPSNPPRCAPQPFRRRRCSRPTRRACMYAHAHA